MLNENWIIPCNIKNYDLIDHFKKHNTVVWHNTYSIKKGDFVYFYLSAPYSEIKYKCIVINDSVDDDLLKANSYAILKKKYGVFYPKKIKYIQLKLEYEYPQGTFPVSNLKENGLSQVQSQARLDRQVMSYITQISNEINGRF